MGLMLITGPKTYFDSNLRERAENPTEVHEHITFLRNRVPQILDQLERAKVFGEIGHWYKVLGNWDEAIENFQQALATCPYERLTAVLEMRIADTLRLKGEFEEAFKRFNQLKEESKDWEELEDFYHQHLGKLYFDQQKYKEALECFQSAWVLREKKKNPELIQSTEIAIAETLKRIRS
jgi:tetratricopeptide (TPR) repeat protein